jgi:hypothetical protein
MSIQRDTVRGTSHPPDLECLDAAMHAIAYDTRTTL